MVNAVSERTVIICSKTTLTVLITHYKHINVQNLENTERQKNESYPY